MGQIKVDINRGSTKPLKFRVPDFCTEETFLKPHDTPLTTFLTGGCRRISLKVKRLSQQIVTNFTKV